MLFMRAASRAFNASLLGCLMCPGMAHLYSSCLLIELDTSQRSATGRRHRVRATNINTVVLAVLGVGAVYRYLL